MGFYSRSRKVPARPKNRDGSGQFESVTLRPEVTEWERLVPRFRVPLARVKVGVVKLPETVVPPAPF